MRAAPTLLQMVAIMLRRKLPQLIDRVMARRQYEKVDLLGATLLQLGNVGSAQDNASDNSSQRAVIPVTSENAGRGSQL